MSLLLPRPAAQPSLQRQAHTGARAARWGPIKGFPLTIKAASSGAHGAFDTTSPGTTSSGAPSPGTAQSRGPRPACSNDNCGDDNCGDPAAGPVRYGYTADIAARFA